MYTIVEHCKEYDGIKYLLTAYAHVYFRLNTESHTLVENG